MCQAVLWSQIRVGGLKTCKGKVPEMTKRDWEKLSVAGERDDEAGEVERGLSSLGFGGDVLESLFHPKRSFQRYLSLSLVQNRL